VDVDVDVDEEVDEEVNVEVEIEVEACGCGRFAKCGRRGGSCEIINQRIKAVTEGKSFKSNEFFLCMAVALNQLSFVYHHIISFCIQIPFHAIFNMQSMHIWILFYFL